MRLFELTGPLQATAYCHGPADQAFDPGKLISASDHDRWNERGEPTLYLAGDLGAALVELGRHLELDVDGDAAAQTDGPTPDGPTPLMRTMWRVDLDIERVADLRDPHVRAVFNLRGGPDWLFDRRRCRDLSTSARASRDVEALIVPSAGLADHHDRWNVVIFAECLTRPLESVVSGATPVGSVCLERED